MGLFAACQANASIVTATCDGTTSDGTVSASAVFTISDGVVTVVLTDLGQNQTSAGQLISGLSFSIAGASSLYSWESSGILATIATDGSGSYSTTGNASSLDHWNAGLSGSTITLSTLSGGQPNQLIIGGDSMGRLDGSGVYNNANSSILNHNPVVLGSATFTLNIDGITDVSAITNVNFMFGSTGTTLPGIVTYGTSVPEPTTVLAGALLLLPLGWQTFRQLRKPQASA